MKAVFKFFANIFKTFLKGFYFLCSILSKGFFFYPKQVFVFLEKIFKNTFFDKIVKHYTKRQQQPEFCLLIVLYILAFVTLFKILYVKPVEVVHHNINPSDNTPTKSDDSTGTTTGSDSSNADNSGTSVFEDSNPYRKFAKTSLDQVNISELKKKNPDVVGWLSVDGTNINYPIVKSSDNDYYLGHSFNKRSTQTGWTFMDYRNDPNMSDYNTIFYGHNLLNKTAFGSISNIFTENWVNSSNKSIVFITEEKTYYYTIFSAYSTAPEVYYLQNVFYGKDEYQNFLNTISSRNILAIDNSVSVNDRIITLSTCRDGSSGRSVIHAKLVSVY